MSQICPQSIHVRPNIPSKYAREIKYIFYMAPLKIKSYLEQVLDTGHVYAKVLMMNKFAQLRIVQRRTLTNSNIKFVKL